jgi:glycosyltransferase involved in cell wall biosynthesis
VSSTDPIATVVITTKNRKDELCGALESVLAQTVPLEVLVIDDGSTDGTTETVRAKFPGVKLIRSDSSHGYIVQRNHAARLATTPFIFSIDDDAVFSTPYVVEQTLADFNGPRIGAVAIPFIEPLKSNQLMQRAPSRDRIWITDSFIGTAHALRRDLFLQMHGYREALVHQGEERDFCIRMLECGWVTRLGNSDPILHYESSRRDFRRWDYFGRRNDILFVWHCVPLRWFPVHLAAASFNGVRTAFRVGRYYSMATGMFAGYCECFRRWSERSPVSKRTYLLYRNLRKSGALPFDEVGLGNGSPELMHRSKTDEPSKR